MTTSQGENGEMPSLARGRVQGRRVWLQRKLDEAVTDQLFQQKYDEIKANTDQEIPPLEDVRVQIEQQLRQDAFITIQEDLRSDVEIVFYGPEGKPQTASSD